ncbi:acid phosphatase class B [Arthrobacter sp. UYCu511]|uniref:hypothetical protein n=1 Tax=Arthrobacter sp. UYCu511 TaxID=3156337 RepID=UPI0033985F49
MIVGFDYWQVISHYPTYFRELAMMHLENGDEVVVISAVGHRRVGTIATALTVLGFPNSVRVHEVVFDSPAQSPELKLAKCKELGVQVFYDDRDDVCRLLNRNDILAMRVTRKDGSTYDLGAERG